MNTDYHTDTTASSQLRKDDDPAYTNGHPSAFRAHAPAQPILNVQPARREDLQPSYAQIIKPDTQDDNQHGWYGDMINTLGSCLGTCGAIPFMFCFPNPYRSVMQGHVGLVTKFGRFSRACDPGLVRINPLSEKLVQVDVKIQIVGRCRQISRAGYTD